MVASQADLPNRYWDALADAASAHAIMLRDLATIDDGYLASILGAIEQARGSEVARMALAVMGLDERIDV